MKRGIWWIGVLMLWTMVAEAQVKKAAQGTNKKAAITKAQKAATPENTTSIQHLISQGQYRAKKPSFWSPTTNTYTISDPTIMTFNQRANGAPVAFDGKSILGVPKIVYGVGNGQLLFRSRGATTSGTGTGNGMVGTGSSVGPIGTNGLALGVNGKSPYAGPIMDGMIVTDVNKRQATTTKKDRKLRPEQKQ